MEGSELLRTVSGARDGAPSLLGTRFFPGKFLASEEKGEVAGTQNEEARDGRPSCTLGTELPISGNYLGFMPTSQDAG